MSDGERPVAVLDERGDPGGTEVEVGRLQTLALLTLDAMSVPSTMELTVLLVDTGRMTELNGTYMGTDGPTDVLAFPLDDVDDARSHHQSILGDVVLCPDVAAAQARRNVTTPEDEMEMLVVHGILHLLGYDHAEPTEKDGMFQLTDALLSTFRTGNPRPSGALP